MNHRTMLLEILISTINQGIEHIDQMLMPARPDVRYLIVWQHTDGKPYRISSPIATRNDLRLLTCRRAGLSHSRNLALRHAQGTILLFADDDCRYTSQYVGNLLDAFAEHPRADIICLKASTESGEPLKAYPANPFHLSHRPKGYYPSSVEIACRRTDRLPAFDERFGLGSKHLACGEEEVFLYDALKNGLAVVFYPATVVETDSYTTGSRFSEEAAVRRAKGAVLCKLHGLPGGTARCVYEAFRIKQASWTTRLSYLRDMLVGIKHLYDGRTR